MEERCKEFKRMVQKKMTPGQLQRAVQSQDYKRIYREVIDCYYSTTHLKSIGKFVATLQKIMSYKIILN